MKIIITFIFVFTLTIINKSPQIECSNDDTVVVTPKSIFYDSFLPENIDQVIESASNIHDLEPDLAASDDDEDEVKVYKETGHDDKNKKKYKIKKNFNYSKLSIYY